MLRRRAKRGSKQPSIVLVVHALAPEEASGTPLVATGYANELARRGWRVRVLHMKHHARLSDELRLERLPGEAFERVPLPAVTRPGSVWTLDAPVQQSDGTGTGSDTTSEWYARFERLIQSLAPSVMHVVDNVHLSLSIPEVARRRGVPVVRTVSCAEDLCALVAPVSPNSGPAGYCPAPLTPERCARCVASLRTPSFERFVPTGDPEGDRHRETELLGLLEIKRARAVRHFTDVYDRIVFASEGFRTYFEATLPLDPDKVRVVPMGVDLPTSAPGRVGGAALEANEPIRFVLAANADAVKGIDAVVAAFSHPDLATREDWRLLLAGGGDRSLFGGLCKDPRVDDVGPYTPADLPGLLAGADVGLSPSVFETFHRVTREYLAAHLPVIGSGAFGIADIIEHGRNGLRFDHADPGSLGRALTCLLEDRPLLARLQQGAALTQIRTVAEEVDELEALYGEVIGGASRAGVRTATGD